MTATELAAALAARATEVCRHLLPGGKEHAGNWVIGSVQGGSGKSLHIQITGDKAGRWLDFSTGEKGDMMGLWRAVTGQDIKVAYRDAAEFLGLQIEPDVFTPSRSWVQLQSQMGTGTEHDIQALAALRHLPNTDGLRAAIDSRQLFFAPVTDGPDGGPYHTHHSWLVTDDRRQGAQARRMDGKLWTKGEKSKTIHGTTGKWPVGIANAGASHDIALTEGGPDHLAAFTALSGLGLLDTIHPVTMLGSGQSIHRDAVPLFKGRTIWLFPHDDENLAGLQGAIRWTNALRSVSCTVIPFNFKPYGVKDLNDFLTATLTPETAEADCCP